MGFNVDTASFLRVEADEELFLGIRQEVAAYVASANKNHKGVLIVKFIFYASLLAGGYWLVFEVQSFYWLLVLYVSIGFLLVLLGLNFAHDFAHNTIFKNPRLNNFFFETIFLLMGVNGYLWKRRHVYSHHTFPNMPGYDVDIELSGIIRLSPEQPARFYHSFQHLYAPVLYLTYSLYWILYKDVRLFFRTKHANLTFHRHPVREWAKLLLFKLIYFGYILLIPAFFSSFSWMQLLAAFMLMNLLKSAFLLFTFLISHHVEATAYQPATPVYSSWFMHQIRSANDFHPFSRIANFIFGGFNCHVAHHLFPALPHPYYPAVSRIIYRHLTSQGISVHQTSYIGGIISHLRLLKHLARELPLQTT